MLRISGRSPPIGRQEAEDTNKDPRTGARKAKGKVILATSRSLQRDEIQGSKTPTEQTGRSPTSAPTLRSKPIKSKDAQPIDWKSAFVMADLTKTPVHSARLAMLDILEAVHANTPGGIFAPGKWPKRDESHISVVEIPVDDLGKEEQKKERPDTRAIKALQAIQRHQSAARLALDEHELELFQGPRGPVKEFEVLCLKLRDPDDSLHRFRSQFQSFGGVAEKKTAEMHLTLAYLKLGSRLDASTEQALLQLARQANRLESHSDKAGGTGWKQRDFYYSGRYSDKKFSRMRLKD